MKKIIFGLFLLASPLSAQGLGDLIKATLLDHIGPVVHYDDKGNTRYALIDSVILIGRYKENPIFQGQVGLAGLTKPENQGDGLNLIAGGLVRVDPFFGEYVNIPDHWEFLKAVEWGPVGFYDFTEREWYSGIQVGLSFDLNPVQ